MDEYLPMVGFVEEWARYLERHGHEVHKPANRPDILQSRNGQNRRYRWLFRCSDRDSILLTSRERKQICRQLRLARNLGERAYVVVKFSEPASKVVVVPAVGTIKAKRVTSDKGGIPWDC